MRYLKRMTSISGPRIPFEHPDRFLSCQEEIDAAVREIIHAAVLAGWTEQEASAALVEVADNRMLALVANAETDAMIALATAVDDGA